jgi:hypothetical protein
MSENGETTSRPMLVASRADAIGPTPMTPADVAERRRSWLARSYLARHWRGELPLGLSYWLNGFLGNIAVVVIVTVLARITDAAFTPERALAATVVIWLITLTIVLWQIVGVWRSAGNHRARGGRRFWAGLAKFMVIIGVLQSGRTFAEVGYPQIAEYISILNGDPTVGPHQLLVLRGGTELELSGGITFGVADEIATILAASPQIRVIHLNSQGGRILEGQRLAKIIRQNRLMTYSATYCLSACTIAFLGGMERWISTRAKLGFHQGAFPGLKPEDLVAEHNAIKEEMVQAGVTVEFANRALSTPAATMWYPTVEELLSSHMITGVADDAQFALSGIGPRSPDATEQLLLKEIPYMKDVKRLEPEIYAQMMSDVMAAIRAGDSTKEIRMRMFTRIPPIVLKYMPSASTAAIYDYMSMVLTETKEIGNKDADACYGFIMGADSKYFVDPAKYLGPDLGLQEAKAAAEILATAGTNALSPSEEAEGEKLLASLVQRLRKKHGAKAQVLAGLEDPSTDHADACAMVIALYEEAFSLQSPQRELVLRVLFKG